MAGTTGSTTGAGRLTAPPVLLAVADLYGWEDDRAADQVGDLSLYSPSMRNGFSVREREFSHKTYTLLIQDGHRIITRRTPNQDLTREGTDHESVPQFVGARDIGVTDRKYCQSGEKGESSVRLRFEQR